MLCVGVHVVSVVWSVLCVVVAVWHAEQPPCCAWCRYTRGRFESRHEGRVERTHGHTHTHTPNTTPTQHHTETDRDSERERDRKDGERERKEDERGERRDDERREEEEEAEEKEKKKEAFSRAPEVACTYMSVSPFFAHFLTRKRNLEHVRSTIVLFQAFDLPPQWLNVPFLMKNV